MRALIWAVLLGAIVVSVSAAATSPLLAWRDPIYIAAGLAGVIALGLMLVQPTLMSGRVLGLSAHRGRSVHRWVGGVLAALVAVHVAGLWITSPPDVIDALLFRSPTPFSAWGVIAMWAVFATALLAALRRRLRLRPRTWRAAHAFLVAAIVVGSVVHAIQIDGTMEVLSKTALCALVVLATVMVLADLWNRSRRTAPR